MGFGTGVGGRDEVFVCCQKRPPSVVYPIMDGDTLSRGVCGSMIGDPVCYSFQVLCVTASTASPDFFFLLTCMRSDSAVFLLCKDVK